jgi:hypothetical protein
VPAKPAAPVAAWPFAPTTKPAASAPAAAPAPTTKSAASAPAVTVKPVLPSTTTAWPLSPQAKSAPVVPMPPAAGKQSVPAPIVQAVPVAGNPMVPAPAPVSNARSSINGSGANGGSISGANIFDKNDAKAARRGGSVIPGMPIVPGSGGVAGKSAITPYGGNAKVEPIRGANGQVVGQTTFDKKNPTKWSSRIEQLPNGSVKTTYPNGAVIVEGKGKKEIALPTGVTKSSTVIPNYDGGFTRNVSVTKDGTVKKRSYPYERRRVQPTSSSNHTTVVEYVPIFVPNYRHYPQIYIPSHQTGGVGGSSYSSIDHEQSIRDSRAAQEEKRRLESEQRITSVANDVLVDYLDDVVFAEERPSAWFKFKHWISFDSENTNRDFILPKLNTNMQMQLQSQVAGVLENFNNRQPLTVDQIVNLESGQVVRPYAFIAEGDFDTQYSEVGGILQDQNCRVAAGRTLEIVSYDKISGLMTAKVGQALRTVRTDDSAACELGKTVKITMEQAQGLVNSLMEKVGDAIETNK